MFKQKEEFKLLRNKQMKRLCYSRLETSSLMQISNFFVVRTAALLSGLWNQFDYCAVLKATSLIDSLTTNW